MSLFHGADQQPLYFWRAQEARFDKMRDCIGDYSSLLLYPNPSKV